MGGCIQSISIGSILTKAKEIFQGKFNRKINKSVSIFFFNLQKWRRKGRPCRHLSTFQPPYVSNEVDFFFFSRVDLPDLLF